ncbi:NIPSNAP family protein [Promicromonospora sp. NPDC050249]|uniref:NIPSNAP family protein n=1 Tax=Promicromonospora sp. NPDC050249 TaxID=3154743 RepID=UPI0033D5AE90
MFYEIRRYQTRPGRRDDWVRYMEDVVLPFQQAKGMTVIGSFVDEEDEDGYVWVRRFDDEKDRVTRYAAVYEDPEWRDRIGPAVDELLLADHSVVTRVRPTAASGLQ